MDTFSITLIVFTLFWGFIGVILPALIPKGPHRRLIQTMLILTSACCWLFWLCFYIHQWKPLFGPQLSSIDARILRSLWGTEF